MKEIDNENTTKVNATRDNVYTIYMTQMHTNKYIKNDSSKPTRTSMGEKGKTCMQMHQQHVVAIEVREGENTNLLPQKP